MRFFVLLLMTGALLAGVPVLASAQNTFTISGYVREAETGETLTGASVFIKEMRIGTLTNEYGYYALRVKNPNDSIDLTFAYAGFVQQTRRVLLKGDLVVDVALENANATLDEVLITAQTTYEEEINSTQMSLTSITVKEAKLLPALFGEVDIIKTLQLKPGIQSGGEGTSGLYVRGGGPDQNLIVLDEALVYNPSHLFGLFSTFNSDAVKDVNLYKGGYPAQYGGRLSSVVDVRLKEGNKQKFSGQGGLGLISSRLTLEGPFDKGKGSFVVAGRRTYFDVFTRIINRLNTENQNFDPIPDYYFYDLNAKVNYELGPNDRVFVSGYFGKDVFGFRNDDFNFDFVWGNITTTARWNHLFSPRLFLNTTITFSDYDYVIRNRFADRFSFEIGSGIQDWTGKTDFYYIPDSRHTVRFGASATRHQFSIGRAEANSVDSTFSFQSGTELVAGEYGIYVSDDFEVNRLLTLNGGIRLSGFSSGEKFYWGIEPRLAAKYSLSPKVSVKGSFTQMYQYVHLVANSGASLPTDIWYPSTANIKPQRATQVAAGINIQLGEQFLITNEYYYKWLDNQIDFRDNANLFINENLEAEFVFGKGWAYGTEIYLEKKTGKLTGWIGYTLSWSWRQFDGSMMGDDPDPLSIINDGKPFFPRYDRRHDVSVVAIYQLSKRFSVTGSWVYGTGNAFSLPIGRSFSIDPISGEPKVIPLYGDRNTFRLAPYHRMDVGIVYNLLPKWGESDLTLSIYNAYNRRNAFFVYNEELEDRFQPTQVTLFPVIPSLTWNFKF